MKAFAAACLIWLGITWIIALIVSVPLALAVRVSTLFPPRK